MRFSREMQMPCKRVSLSIGTLLGSLERVRLPGFLREKKKCIWVLYLDPDHIKILCLGTTWNFSKKNRALLITDYGAQRASL